MCNRLQGVSAALMAPSGPGQPENNEAVWTLLVGFDASSIPESIEHEV
jgi:hypothetical protein